MMTNKDIRQIVNEAIKAKENNWTTWLKTLITFIFIPLITVYASFKVLENRVEHVEKEIDDKVDLTLYDQFLIKQIELQKLYNENTERIERDLKESDEEIKEQIREIKEFLNEVYDDKKLWVRNFDNNALYYMIKTES
jgi:hypothetical protein